MEKKLVLLDDEICMTSGGMLYGTVRKYVAESDSYKFSVDYDFNIMKYADDYIAIGIQEAYTSKSGERFYEIKVNQKEGCSIKINKASISNDSGKADDLIDFLGSWLGKNYIPKIIKQFCF